MAINTTKQAEVKARGLIAGDVVYLYQGAGKIVYLGDNKIESYSRKDDGKGGWATDWALNKTGEIDAAQRGKLLEMFALQEARVGEMRGSY